MCVALLSACEESFFQSTCYGMFSLNLCWHSSLLQILMSVARILVEMAGTVRT